MSYEHPKLFKNLFNLTSVDEKVPTDKELDDKIEYLGHLMRYVWPLFKSIVRKKIWFFFRYKWRRPAKYVAYISSILIAVVIIINLVFYKSIVEHKTIVKTEVEEIYVSNLKSYDEFLYEVGYTESRNLWDCESENGMLGRFQFNPGTLKAIGIDVEKEYFLNDTLLQISAFNRLLHLNKIKYQKYITKWAGTPLPQDERYIITESGILMAFHLKPTAAVAYFESECKDDSGSDGNGTTVSSYIKKFSGFKIN